MYIDGGGAERFLKFILAWVFKEDPYKKDRLSHLETVGGIIPAPSKKRIPVEDIAAADVNLDGNW
jgi:hypothetical protein